MNLRKWIAALLLAATALALSACGGKPRDAATEPAVPEKTVTIRVLSKVYIATNNAEPRLWYQCQYDTAGNLTMETESRNISGGEEYTAKTVYTYDAKGNLLTLTRYHNDEKTIWETYTYSDSGKILSWCYERSNGSSLYEYVYDSNDRLVSEQYTSQDGQISPRKRYTYDQNGNLEKMQNIKTNGKDSDYTLYTYDKNNRLISEDLYTYDDQLQQQTLYTYNDAGLLTCVSSRLADLEESRTEYTYNQNGKLIKEQTYSYGVADTCYDYTYDAENRMLTRTYSTTEGLKETTTCTYDETGIQSKVVQFRLHEITYEYTELTVPESRVAGMLQQQENVDLTLRQTSEIYRSW